MKILEQRTLYRDGEYVAFPNTARLKNGDIMCSFRHAKERQKEFGEVTHVDPTAKDVFLLSRDGGKTFDQTLHLIVDDDMSDQDPCLCVLRSGRIIATYFRWALVPKGQGAATWGEELFGHYGRTLHDKYDCFSDGVCMSISDDNGATWRQKETINPPGYMRGCGVRGNILELPSGALLMPIYGIKNPNELSRCALMRSRDAGESWSYFSEMAYDPACVKGFLEPGIFRTESGRIVGLFRTQTDFNIKGVRFDDTYLNLHIAVSQDEGETFGPVTEITNLWGSSPFQALQLRSGKVLLSYGYRREPFGVRVRLCNGELTDIATAEELVLRDDAPCGDLGYPHAIQLEDGSVMVTYYIAGADLIRKIDATILDESTL